MFTLMTIVMTDSIYKQTTKKSQIYYAARFVATGIYNVVAQV